MASVKKIFMADQVEISHFRFINDVPDRAHEKDRQTQKQDLKQDTAPKFL
jgi:hypothetical protein